MSDRPSRWDTPAASAAPADAGASANANGNTGAVIAAPISASDAATAAAAIAAKIAASLTPADGALVKRVSEEGDYIRDIEINDLKNRYVLTKGSTQKEIEEETGASVTTKGTWIHDRSKMMPDETPLYIHIVAKTHTSLQAAAEKVQALIDKELGPLLDARTMAARNRALGLPPPEGWLPGGRVKWPEAKLDIGLESLRNFNVRAKTVGPGGIFVKHIQAETGARVQIKGRGSGFMETDTGRESDEPMHINIAAPTEDQIGRAKALAEDLLVVLRIEYQKARDGTAMGGAPGVYQPGSGTYAPAQNGPDYAGYYNQQAQQQQHQGTPGQMGGTPSAGQATPAPAQAQAQGQGQDAGAGAGAAAGQGAAPGGAMPQEGTEAWNQFAAYWAAYGYDVKDERFQTWYQQTYGGQQPQQ